VTHVIHERIEDETARERGTSGGALARADREYPAWLREIPDAAETLDVRGRLR
jgi:hypothetical protein